LLNTIFIIVLMLSPLALGKNLKLKTADNSVCNYMMIQSFRLQRNGRCWKFTEIGSDIVHGDCNRNDDSVIWKRINNGDGTYSIRPFSNPDLAVQAYFTQSGYPISVNDYDGDADKKFYFYQNGEGMNAQHAVYFIKNVRTNFCLSHFYDDGFYLFDRCNDDHYEKFYEVCVDRTSSAPAPAPATAPAPAPVPAPATAPAPAPGSIFTPNAKDCSNGWTQIVNKGSNMCVKFENAKNRIVQGTCGNGDEFLWKFVALDDGHYLIYSKKGDYVFDSFYGKTDNGNPVWNWDLNKGDNQRLQIKRINNDTSFFNIIFKHSKKCLDNGGSKQENHGIGQWDCVESDNLAFKFTCPAPVFTPNASDCSNGWTQIVNKVSNMCVKFENAKNRIVQGTCVNGDEFLWKFVALDDGHYLIYSKKGDYVFDSFYGKTDNGNPVWNWDFNKGDNQRLQIKRINNDTSFFIIIFKHSKKCLDVPGGSKQENEGLIQWECNDGNNQAFKFTCPNV